MREGFVDCEHVSRSAVGRTIRVLQGIVGYDFVIDVDALKEIGRCQ